MRPNLIAGPGGAHAEAATPCCACSSQATRRDIVALSALVSLGLACGINRTLADGADERPKAGDLLVAIDAAEPVALAASDIPPSPILAWPMESGSNLVRTGSRLNKIVLVRLDPASLVGSTRE